MSVRARGVKSNINMCPMKVRKLVQLSLQRGGGHLPMLRVIKETISYLNPGKHKFMDMLAVYNRLIVMHSEGDVIIHDDHVTLREERCK